MANVFTSSSVWITVLLTVERYISVRYPLKAKELCTSRLARRTIVAVVVLATVVNVPRFFCSSIEPLHRGRHHIRHQQQQQSESTSNAAGETVGLWDVDSVMSTASDVTKDATRVVSGLTAAFVSTETASTDIDDDIVGYKRKSTAFESGDFYRVWTWFTIASVHVVPCLTLLFLNAGLVAIVCRASRRRMALRGGSDASRSRSGSVGCTLQLQQQPQRRSWPMRLPSSTRRWWTRATAALNDDRRGEQAGANGILVVGGGGGGAGGGLGGGDGVSGYVRQHHSHHNSTEQIRMTVTCISIICLFLVCIIPSAFSNRPVAKALFGRNQTMDEFAQGPVYRLLRVVTNLLVYCNLSLNFLLYCVFNHKFLRTLRQTCCRYWSAVTGRRESWRMRSARLTSASGVASTGCASCLCCWGCGGAAAVRTDGDGGEAGGADGAAAEVAINRGYMFRISSSTSGGSAGRNSGMAGGGQGDAGSGSGVSGATSRTPGEFLVLEVEAGLPVVISMQRRRAGYEALRSAACGSLAFQFPVKDRPKTRPKNDRFD